MDKPKGRQKVRTSQCRDSRREQANRKTTGMEKQKDSRRGQKDGKLRQAKMGTAGVDKPIERQQVRTIQQKYRRGKTSQ
jgi:hypothetical protein